MSDFTSFLFARPSFAEGVARLIDVGGSLDVYNTSLSPEEADRRALTADWNQVGADLWAALGEEAKRLPEAK